MYPLPISYTAKYAAMLLFTVPVKLFLLLFYRRASKKQPSAVFGSLGLDSILDFFITLCSFSALILSHYIGLTVDGLAGLGISCVLVFQGVGFVKESLGTLLGKRDNALCERISSAVSKVDGIKSVRSVQCHIYGKNTVADIVVEMEDETVSKDLIERIKAEIKEENVSEIYVGIGG
jgi:divalent metal cation (Fe/Co/Zn/Cd) transporter